MSFLIIFVLQLHHNISPHIVYSRAGNHSSRYNNVAKSRSTLNNHPGKKLNIKSISYIKYCPNFKYNLGIWTNNYKYYYPNPS